MSTIEAKRVPGGHEIRVAMLVHAAGDQPLLYPPLMEPIVAEQLAQFERDRSPGTAATIVVLSIVITDEQVADILQASRETLFTVPTEFKLNIQPTTN